MSDHEVAGTPSVSENAERSVPIETAANIEHFLNNHTREGGRAAAHNMVARPANWHPLPPRSGD